jgi:hypothetical protein
LTAEFAPTIIVWPDDAVPDAVDTPATVIEAPKSFDVGVRVMVATAFTMVVVYAVVLDAKAGLREPELSTNEAKSASTFTDAVLVTATAYVVVADVVS